MCPGLCQLRPTIKVQPTVHITCHGSCQDLQFKSHPQFLSCVMTPVKANPAHSSCHVSWLLSRPTQPTVYVTCHGSRFISRPAIECQGPQLTAWPTTPLRACTPTTDVKVHNPCKWWPWNLPSPRLAARGHHRCRWRCSPVPASWQQDPGYPSPDLSATRGSHLVAGCTAESATGRPQYMHLLNLPKSHSACADFM